MRHGMLFNDDKMARYIVAKIIWEEMQNIQI
jgi:hypothetical protein